MFEDFIPENDLERMFAQSMTWSDEKILHHIGWETEEDSGQRKCALFLALLLSDIIKEHKRLKITINRLRLALAVKPNDQLISCIKILKSIADETTLGQHFSVSNANEIATILFDLAVDIKENLREPSPMERLIATKALSDMSSYFSAAAEQDSNNTTSIEGVIWQQTFKIIGNNKVLTASYRVTRRGEGFILETTQENDTVWDEIELNYGSAFNSGLSKNDLSKHEVDESYPDRVEIRQAAWQLWRICKNRLQLSQEEEDDEKQRMQDILQKALENGMQKQLLREFAEFKDYYEQQDFDDDFNDNDELPEEDRLYRMPDISPFINMLNELTKKLHARGLFREV